MIYAPVIIPTLCRFEHLKQCLESLAANTDADKTEVFLGLDYPLKPSHEPGYKKICEYLETSDIASKFKQLHVYKRPHNFGAHQNAETLRIEVTQSYDRYIYSEDDNVFSPNFLQYINKGLIQCENDSSISAVCGYCHYIDMPHDNNNYYRTNIGFCAWGYGIIAKRRDDVISSLSRKYLLCKLLNPFQVIKMARHSYSTLLFAIMKCIKPQFCSDNVFNMYMWFKHKDILMPVVSKVRNIGCDGSGEHCVANESIAKRYIDNDLTFDYIGTGMEYYSEINAKHLEGQRAYMSGKDMLHHMYNMVKVRLPKFH